MISNINRAAIINPLFSWYHRNKRDLPWRNTKDPYKIWLSEVILQQTRVEQGLPYYLKFAENYPTIQHLSKASIDEVLRHWQGLGYYSRARNLHKCAKTVSNDFGGVFPSQRKELLKLPGIGPYTAAAIASIAFGEREAVVDGNVLRVVTRLYGIDDDIGEQKTVKKISNIVAGLIPHDQPDVFNQAIMEFGARYCVPKNPACQSCVMGGICEAKSKGLQALLPVKSKKIAKRKRYFNYLIIQNGSKILMRKRDFKDIWRGLFEFYLLESDENQHFNMLNLPRALLQSKEDWQLVEESKTYKHVLTHQHLFCRFYHLQLEDDSKLTMNDFGEYKPYSISEIEQLPKPILIDKYLGEKII